MESNKALRVALPDLCRLIYEKGMVCGSGGNISVGAGDKLLITPSGYSLGIIKPEDMVEVTFEGKIEGSVKPSKELFLHMEAYRARPEITVVVHVHSFYSTLVGIMADDNEKRPMPPYTPGYVMRVKNITQVPFYVPGSFQLARSIGEKLKESDVVFMKNHGMVVVGRDFQEAFNVTEEVEQNAKMHFILRGRGFLTDEQVQAILEKYK